MADPAYLAGLASSLLAARTTKAKAEAALKDANAVVDACERALFDAMVEAELPKMTAAGSTFSLDMKDYYSVPGEAAEEVHEAMESLGLGGIYRYVANAQTMQATLRELAGQHDGELPEQLAGLVTVYAKSRVNVRKATRA